MAGGFPAALARPAGRRRTAWYRDYVQAQLEKDVRDMARITMLEALPRLLMLAAAQTATLLDVSNLASSFSLSRLSISAYLGLLERVFMLELLRPWHSNRLRRLVKTPKLHIGDTGLACALLGLDARSLAKHRGLLGLLLGQPAQLTGHAPPKSALTVHAHRVRSRINDFSGLIPGVGSRVAGIRPSPSNTNNVRN